MARPSGNASPSLSPFPASAGLGYGHQMKPEPPIFDQVDEAADAKRHDEAIADIAAGHVIPNDAVCDWLETWGTPDEQPAPAEWFR